MDFGLNDKTALVLGGSGGLGSAIAKTLSQEGVKVAVAGRDPAKVAAVVAEIIATGGKAMPAVWSLDNLNAGAEQISAVEAAFGGVDILVNNTGGPPPSPASGQEPELWRRQFDSMVLPVIAIADKVLPGMRQRRWGRIIVSASSGVVAPIPNLGLSNSLRSALVGWAKTLASEVAKDGITVNVTVPGRIATDRISFLDEQKAKRSGLSTADVVMQSQATIPLGRYGTPEEYAAVVAFLCSQQASYVTGSIMRVDGGMIPST